MDVIPPSVVASTICRMRWHLKRDPVVNTSMFRVDLPEALIEAFVLKFIHQMGIVWCEAGANFADEGACWSAPVGPTVPENTGAAFRDRNPSGALSHYRPLRKNDASPPAAAVE
jgi:hypothetical protein